MSTPEYQAIDATAAPDPVTPAATLVRARPGMTLSPPRQRSGAVQHRRAVLDDLTAVYAQSLAVTGGGEGAPTGAGLPDRMSPRQSRRPLSCCPVSTGRR